MPSISFVTVAEIHNVDVPGPSNRDTTVLPTDDTQALILSLILIIFVHICMHVCI